MAGRVGHYRLVLFDSDGDPIKEAFFTARSDYIARCIVSGLSRVHGFDVEQCCLYCSLDKSGERLVSINREFCE